MFTYHIDIYICTYMSCTHFHTFADMYIVHFHAGLQVYPANFSLRICKYMCTCIPYKYIYIYTI